MNNSENAIIASEPDIYESKPVINVSVATQESIHEPEIDEDIVRIKSKIVLLNNILKQGTVSMIISMIVSYIVTLEISNGSEKITIQEILAIVKDKINELNKLFDELTFSVKDITHKHDLVLIEKQKFRKSVYKLFDIKDLVNILVTKCVSLGGGLKRLLPLFNTTYIDYLTISLVDSVLFTETQLDFETKILEYIVDRTSSIADPVARKLTKINMLYNILNIVTNEKAEGEKGDKQRNITVEKIEVSSDKNITENISLSKNTSNDDNFMIELHDMGMHDSNENN